MAATLPETAPAASSASSDARFWPLVALVVLLVVQASMTFTRAINWDEFFFYHQVAAFAEGELDSPLQTFNTRIFFWLPGLFGSNVDHIVAARLVMMLFEIGTLAGLYVIARRFTDCATAVFVPLLYLSAGYVLQHGMSFRVDPMAACLLVGALAVLVRSKLDWKSIVLFGLFAGIAGMVTIKAVLYLPAFAAIATMRLLNAQKKRGTFVRIAACGIAALACFAALFFWHSSAVTGGSQSVNAPPSLLADSLSWMFFLGLPPYGSMAVKAMMLAPIFTIAVIAAPFLLKRSERSLPEKIALLGLWFPVFTPFFYTNSAAYLYAYILAPVAVGCVPALEWARRRLSGVLITAALAGIALSVFAVEDRQIIDRQRQLESNVRELFPQPVTYFDHNFMMGSWPKANRFMTPWGMHRYRSGGESVYRMAMERETVPLLLGNWEGIHAFMQHGDDGVLLPPDTAALRENYVAVSPFIYAAGKQFDAGASLSEVEFLVPGEYSVLDNAITLDGQRHEIGERVQIDRGKYAVEVDASADASLVWSSAAGGPREPLSQGPIFVGF